MPYMPDGFEVQPLKSLVHKIDDNPDEIPWEELIVRERAQRKEEIRKLDAEGKTLHEIADLLGAKVNSIRSHLAILRRES